MGARRKHSTTGCSALTQHPHPIPQVYQPELEKNKALVFHLLPLPLLGKEGKVRSRDPGVAAHGFTNLLRSSFLSFEAGCCLGQKSKISRKGEPVSAAGERELLVVETFRK